MKYIDADKLIALIDAKLEDLGLSGSVWVGRSVLQDLKNDIITSLQQEQPEGLDEAAEKYSQTKNPYGKNAFKAGAEWMAGQGVTVKGLQYGGNLGIPDIIPEEFYTDKQEEVIVQIRKNK